MRFKKGDKVEVMDRKEVPVSWRTAEILSCNDNFFCLRYDSFPGLKREPLVESVLRKFVRPCPPLALAMKNWACWDIVEVFHDFSWKIAAVLKILGCKKTKKRKIGIQAAVFQNQFLVRLMGNSMELTIDISNMRMRQTWHEDKWILPGKNFSKWEDTTANNPSSSICEKNNIHADAAFWESESPRYVKRMPPYSSSIAKAHNGHSRKLRAVQEDGGKQRRVVAPVLKKVDAVAYPREPLGEKNMHTSFDIISYRYNQTKRAKQNDVIGCSWVKNSECSSSDNDVGSVGSCSVTSQSPNNLHSHFIPLKYQVKDDSYCSDAESCCGSGYDRKSCPLSLKEDVKTSIRRLELHAYRSTLEALYASGPLSWEQESLLTNLRIMLHISNDEHLTELQHLISAKTLVHAS